MLIIIMSRINDHFDIFEDDNMLTNFHLLHPVRRLSLGYIYIN